MKKSEYVTLIAERTELSKKTISMVIDEVFDVIGIAMKKGDLIRIPGFGAFTTKLQKERNGRNPKTGKAMKIPAKNVIRFRPSKELKDSVKGL